MKTLSADRIETERDAILKFLQDPTWPRENVPEMLRGVNEALTYQVNLATSFGVKTERDAILKFLQAHPSAFASSYDTQYVLDTIENGVPGAPRRGFPSERRIRELRLFYVRAKIARWAKMESRTQLGSTSLRGKRS